MPSKAAHSPPDYVLLVCLLHNINVATTQEGDATKPCMQHHFALAEEVIAALLNTQLIFAFPRCHTRIRLWTNCIDDKLCDERILQKPAMIIQKFDYTSCIFFWSNIQLIFKGQTLIHSHFIPSLAFPLVTLPPCVQSVQEVPLLSQVDNTLSVGYGNMSLVYACSHDSIVRMFTHLPRIYIQGLINKQLGPQAMPLGFMLNISATPVS